MRRLPLLFILLAAAGCGGDSNASIVLGPTDANVTGTFNLRTSDGYPLPVLAGYSTDGGTEIDESGDEIIIAAGNTWSELTSFTLTSVADKSTSQLATVSTGTYTISNNRINFVMTAGGNAKFSGSVQGDTLVVAYNGSRMVYTR